MTVVATLLSLLIAIWIYTMALYPIGMATVGKFSRRSGKPMETDTPKVSLIIPCHNEEAVIAAKLENVSKIDYPNDKLEVLVVSDGSEDRTIEIAKEKSLKNLRILDFPKRRGKTSIVNDAVLQCSGSILCLCDANVMFHADALKVLVGRLSDPCIGAVTGDVRLESERSDFGAGESLYYRFERALQIGESVVGSTMGVDGGMYVIRKELFVPPEPSTILDDFVISMRVVMAGHRVVYERDAIANENATPSSGIEYRRRIRVTAGAVQSLRWGIWPSPVRRPIEFWQWGSHKFLRWLSPIVLLAIFASSIVLAMNSALAAFFVALQFFFFTLACLALIFPNLRAVKAIGICYYFALSHLAMLVGFYKGICGTQPVMWRRTQRMNSSQNANL